MNSEKNHDEAVSSVVGEMVLMALVIILVALFSTSAFHLLPGDREDSVDVLMDNTTDSVTFYHKGGDWVEKRDLRVIVIDDDDLTRTEFGAEAFLLSPDTEAFDLGSNLTMHTHLGGGEIVRLATKRNVICSEEI
ncbi:type IV pilin [Methanofollis formosanus]|uniref:Type IV pilin n=1 Tax=Methanofollis formosanus TaxID=299308 RepID=A0A8G1EHL7_9EURY|nr:type IV pilin N-terminal domain-containing protein [Methanofollis formosanus]QYZ80326.1 type IV pilin [Methanofollis formosanus]